MNARRTVCRSLLLHLPVLVLGFLASPARAATPFEMEEAHPYFDLALPQAVSIAVDADLNPHIAYCNSSSADLYYSYRVDGVWVHETVDTGNVGYYASLALDPAGNPHISYYDVGNQDLKYASRASGGGWTYDVVDTTGDMGKYSSLVIDSLGRPHISYYDATNGNLKYARRNEDLTWTTITVDSGGDVGKYCSIALDPNELPHIAYHDATNFNLKYARDVGGFFVWSTAITANSLGLYTSLAIDANGNSHVACGDGITPGVFYAHRDPAGNWTYKSVGSYTNGTSIAVDPLGRPRILSYDFMANTLKYYTKEGVTWNGEVLDTGGTINAFALDSHGNPHVAYSNPYFDGYSIRYADAYVTLTSPAGGERWLAGTQQTVRWAGLGAVQIELSADGGATYQTLADSAAGGSAVVKVPDWATGAAVVRLRLLAEPTFTSDSPGTFTIAPGLLNPWWVDTPDTVSNAGYTTDLALDPRGLAHITHFNFTTQRLRYVSQVGGGAWSVEIPDTTLGSGGYSSLAFDTNGDPHISHWNYYQQTLWYSVRTGGVWSTEAVDLGPGNVGVGSSLALQDGMVPYISYQDNTSGTLKVAHKDGGWILETVDPSGTVGEYTSLALDSGGDPHIAYNDNASGDLRYAYRSNGSYAIEFVDTGGNVGSWASLALDADDVPHIAYYDVTWQDLKYAEKRNGVWKVERIDTEGDVGTNASIALDLEGNPVIAYFDADAYRMKVARRIGGAWSIEYAAPFRSGEFNAVAVDPEGNIHAVTQDADKGLIRYVSSAIELTSPAPGDVWPVGASRTIRWNGSGRVDVSLSTDGGNSFQTLATGVAGGSYGLVVPHQPSAFTQVRVERALPRSADSTPGLFTIQTDITLLSLSVSPAPAGLLGADIAWQTDPGPADLSGYRLEGRTGSGDWTPVASLTRETSFHDPTAVPGEEYRLFGVNGYGEALLLGQARFGIPHPLAAGPLPYRGGDLQITFATAGGLGGGTAPARVALFDLQGRRIKTLAEGDYTAGVQTVTWDGQDEAGRRVGAGIYFLRTAGSGQSHTMKVVVVR